MPIEKNIEYTKNWSITIVAVVGDTFILFERDV
jgi:hypothetical protein